MTRYDFSQKIKQFSCALPHKVEFIVIWWQWLFTSKMGGIRILLVSGCAHTKKKNIKN